MKDVESVATESRDVFSCRKGHETYGAVVRRGESFGGDRSGVFWIEGVFHRSTGFQDTVAVRGAPMHVVVNVGAQMSFERPMNEYLGT